MRSLKAERTFETLKARCQELAEFADAMAVVLFLTDKDSGELDRKDHILGALIADVQRYPKQTLARLIVWLGLWPGLEPIYHRLQQHFPRAPEELLSELGLAFSELLAHIDLSAVKRVAATLTRSTERDVMRGRGRLWAQIRWVGRCCRGASETEHWLEALNQEAAEQWSSMQADSGLALGAEHSDEQQVAVLRVWLQKLVGDDAELVISVAIMGRSQADAGGLLGLSPQTARKRYQRALRRIKKLRDSSPLRRLLSHLAGSGGVLGSREHEGSQGGRR